MSVDPLSGLSAIQAVSGESPGGVQASDIQRMGRAEAARSFESYMVEQMVSEMRRTLPEGALGGRAVDLFAGLLDQQIAERVADRGGLGLADQIMRSWGDGGVSGAAGAPEASAIRHYRRPFGRRSSLRPPGGLPVSGRLSSAFGQRRDPFDGSQRTHSGVDIAAPAGSAIRAVQGGRVTFAGERGGYGRVVMVRHDDGALSLYAHCQDLEVARGDRVRPGQTVATVGQTGRATGPHVHFELRRDGQAVDPIAEYGWRW